MLGTLRSVHRCCSSPGSTHHCHACHYRHTIPNRCTHAGSSTRCHPSTHQGPASHPASSSASALSSSQRPWNHDASHALRFPCQHFLFHHVSCNPHIINQYQHVNRIIPVHTCEHHAHMPARCRQCQQCAQREQLYASCARLDTCPQCAHDASAYTCAHMLALCPLFTYVCRRVQCVLVRSVHGCSPVWMGQEQSQMSRVLDQSCFLSASLGRR